MVEPQASGEIGAQAAAGLGSIRSATSAAGADQGSGNDDNCVLLSSPTGSEWLGREHRRLERFQVQASRPIALRLLDGEGRSQGQWMLADILDISRGGFCLLLSGPLQLPIGQRLQLDVRCHPDFGSHRLESEVRWARSSASFTTVGVAFKDTLPRVPRLELERRSVRRDPNTEPWANE